MQCLNRLRETLRNQCLFLLPKIVVKMSSHSFFGRWYSNERQRSCVVAASTEFCLPNSLVKGEPLKIPSPATAFAANRKFIYNDVVPIAKSFVVR